MAFVYQRAGNVEKEKDPVPMLFFNGTYSEFAAEFGTSTSTTAANVRPTTSDVGNSNFKTVRDFITFMGITLDDFNRIMFKDYEENNPIKGPSGYNYTLNTANWFLNNCSKLDGTILAESTSIAYQRPYNGYSRTVIDPDLLDPDTTVSGSYSYTHAWGMGWRLEGDDLYMSDRNYFIETEAVQLWRPWTQVDNAFYEDSTTAYPNIRWGPFFTTESYSSSDGSTYNRKTYLPRVDNYTSESLANNYPQGSVSYAPYDPYRSRLLGLQDSTIYGYQYKKLKTGIHSGQRSTAIQIPVCMYNYYNADKTEEWNYYNSMLNFQTLVIGITAEQEITSEYATEDTLIWTARQTQSFTQSVSVGTILNSPYMYNMYAFDYVPPIVDPEDEGTVEGGQSGGNIGGGGSGDDSSDALTYPQAIPVNPVTKANTAFLLNSVSLKDFNTQLWNGAFWEVDGSEALNYLLSLRAYPANLDIAKDIALQEIGVGKHTIQLSCGFVYTLSSTVLSDVLWKFETDKTAERFGSYLDYEPYTSCQIYLPYSGYHVLEMNDVNNWTIGVFGSLDIISGIMSYTIYKSNEEYSNIPIKKVDCKIGYDIPMNATNQASHDRNMLSAIVSGTSSLAGLAGGIATGNPLLIAGGAAGLATTAASAMGEAPTVAVRGSTSASYTDWKFTQDAFLVFTRPIYEEVESYIKYNGQNSYKMLNGSQLQNFAKVISTGWAQSDILDKEKDMIESLLKDGVHFDAI